MTGLVTADCSAVTAGNSSPATSGGAAPEVSASGKAADRLVCVDLDARGGALYSVFVVPMMAGAGGRKSIDVNAAQLTRAVASLTEVGKGSLENASPKVADEGQRLVAAAEAFQVYSHAEGTALLTSFVGLSIACAEAGHQPSWFNAAELAP
jgi:hypothetical protein